MTIKMENFFRKANNYRIWIDDLGIGHIRILKRTNFKIIMSIFEEIHSEVKKRNDKEIKIVFYVSKSLYDEMSISTKEFIGFCQSCVGIKFELILLELDKL